jgi:hypothetical protein
MPSAIPSSSAPVKAVTFAGQPNAVYAASLCVTAGCGPVESSGASPDWQAIRHAAAPTQTDKSKIKFNLEIFRNTWIDPNMLNEKNVIYGVLKYLSLLHAEI